MNRRSYFPDGKLSGLIEAILTFASRKAASVVSSQTMSVVSLFLIRVARSAWMGPNMVSESGQKRLMYAAHPKYL